MSGDREASTAAQRMIQARRVEVGMADLIDMAVTVMRTRVRRLFHRRQTVPVFELLIVTDELANLAACLADRRGVRS
jgi:hypothetical protein